MSSELTPTRVRLAPVAPWDEGAPAIHGPDISGASAGKPFLYAVPTTGERPMRFAAEGLPEGLRLDPASGHISGAARRDGDFRVLLRAENRHGKAEKEFAIAIGRGLALTPPMGWNSWNAWRRWVDDGKVRAAADGLVRTGLAARGYTYVNIDSCWQGERGGKHNAIQPNRKFPDMARARWTTSTPRGSSSASTRRPGLCRGAAARQQAMADWGGPGLIGCSSGAPDPDYTPNPPIPGGPLRGHGQARGPGRGAMGGVGRGLPQVRLEPTDPLSLERMGRLVKAAARDIVLSICTDARLEHVDAYKTWAQMWRGIPDTFDQLVRACSRTPSCPTTTCRRTGGLTSGRAPGTIWTCSPSVRSSARRRAAVPTN